MMKKLILIAAPTLVFAAMGYFYYGLVGCNGTCAIASSPYLSILFGAVIGALLGSILIDWRKKNANL